MVANLHTIQLFHYFEVIHREEGMLHGLKDDIQDIAQKNQRQRNTEGRER